MSLVEREGNRQRRHRSARAANAGADRGEARRDRSGRVERGDFDSDYAEDLVPARLRHRHDRRRRIRRACPPNTQEELRSVADADSKAGRVGGHLDVVVAVIRVSQVRIADLDVDP